MKPSLRLAILSFLCILGIFCAGPPSVAAATPREELLRLVPPDVAFCLVIGDLRDHTDRLLQSPWFKALRQSPLGEALAASPEVKRLEKFLSQDLPKNLQIDWPRLRDDILGDAIVFAYRPGPSARPEQENGLFLLWARDAELLARLIARLNSEQLRSREVMVVNAYAHQGKKYFERLEQKGERYVYYPVNGPMHVLPVAVPVPMTAHQYYYLDGSLLVFSTDRAMLLRAIEAQAARAEAGKVAPVSAQLLRAGAEKALAAWWMNPRAFDTDIQQHAARSQPAEAQGLWNFLGYWQALDALVLALKVTPDMEVNLSVQGRQEALPAAARRFLTAASRPSELWERFPKGSILALAVRVDAVALSDVLAAFLTSEARKTIATNLQRTMGAAMGMDLTATVLGQLGPDVGFCVAAAPGQTGFPHVLAALRVQPGPEAAPVDLALVKALRFFASLAVFDHNRRVGDQMRVENVVQDRIEVNYLTGGKALPAGLQPAVALKEGYLVLASTPDAIRRFRSGETTAAVGSATPLLRLSTQELANFLQGQRELISGFLSKKNQLSPEAASQWLEKLLASLALFERFEVTQRTDEGHLLLTVRLKTKQKTK